MLAARTSSVVPEGRAGEGPFAGRISMREARSRERRDDLDLPDDRLVELRKLFGGNPIFLMRTPAGILDLECVEEFLFHVEPGDALISASSSGPTGRHKVMVCILISLASEWLQSNAE
jgi:hypothetical protein